MMIFKLKNDAVIYIEPSQIGAIASCSDDKDKTIEGQCLIFVHGVRFVIPLSPEAMHVAIMEYFEEQEVEEKDEMPFTPKRVTIKEN